MKPDSINYALLIDTAMQNIVKETLEIAIDNKLPGDHHFFISFLTNFPGVFLSEKLKNKYPKEMTIVLQYQFENLIVKDTEFSVNLSFDNIRENITVPFKALTAFADPSVKFGLQFKHVEEMFQNNENYEEDPSDLMQKNYDIIDERELQIAKAIEKSGATNVITLDKFRKK